MCACVCVVTERERKREKFGKGARSIMAIVIGNGLGDRNSNPEETVCILPTANTFGKSIHPTIHPSGMDK